MRMCGGSMLPNPAGRPPWMTTLCRAADAADFERKRGRKGRTVVGPRTALPKPGMLGLGPIPGASTWRQQFKELQDAAMAQNGEVSGWGRRRGEERRRCRGID